MEKACKDCWGRYEHSYWTNFESHRFYQFLRGDFDQRLAIPEYFTRNLKKQLPARVTLKGPSGISWDVDLMMSGNVMFFSHGWKEFVMDHVLEENDLLIFKLNSDLSFDVLMFGGQSLCEKEMSYFVHKFEHDKHYNGCRKEGKARKSLEVVPPLPQDVVGGNPLWKSISDNVDAIPLGCPSIPGDIDAMPLAQPFVHQATCEESPKQCPTKRKAPGSSNEVVNYSRATGGGSSSPESANSDSDEASLGQSDVAQALHKKSRKEIQFSKPKRTRWSVRNRKLSALAREARANAGAANKSIIIDVDASHTSITKKARYNCNYKSSRRTITEEEKKNALQLAEAALTSEGFMVVMKPTHVYNKFFMTIPLAWIKKHLSMSNQDMILRVKDSTWRVKFSYINSHGYGGLAHGWREFATENNLEESDICVFERGRHMDGCILFDVNIFRVVSEVRPSISA